MEIRHLGNTEFDVIMESFLLAFDNYFVKMPTDFNFYRERWKAAGVRLDLSYGMFHNDELVGFIINAIDERHGEMTAYNSGTGVIPENRGNRIVGALYDYAFPELMKNGITKCQLEVITENEKAIKSYEGIGFKRGKHYKCFKGEILSVPKTSYTLRKVTYNAMVWDSLPNQNLYSWDNQKESLVNGNYEYYQVLIGDELQSYFIISTDTGYVAQFEVLEDTREHWNRLFHAIKSINNNIRINNIDARLTSKIEAVNVIGLINTIDQFEMELDIK